MKKKFLIIDLDGRIKKDHGEEGNDLFSPISNFFHLKPSYDLKIENKKLCRMVSKVFNRLPKRMAILQNTYYIEHVKQSYCLLEQIKNLMVRNSYTKLVLVGGGKVRFLSTFCTIGERKSYLFKSSYYFNYIIWKTFKNSIDIEFVQRDLFFTNFLFQIVRDVILSSAVVLKHLFKHKSTGQNIIEKNSRICLFPYMLPLQLEQFNLIANKFHRHRIIKLKLHARYLGRVEIISKLFRYIYKDMLFLLFHNGRRKSFVKLNFRLYFSFLPMYLKCIFYQFNLSFQTRCLRANNKRLTILTNMSIGEDICSVHYYAKINCIRHINYSIVCQNPTQLVTNELSSIYYFTDNQNHEFWKKQITNLKVDNLNIFKAKITNDKKSRMTITFFTQPDRYLQYSIEVFRKLFLFSKDFPNIQFIVKPHYRDETQYFNLIRFKTHNFIIKSKDENIYDCIKMTDIGLSFSSTVLNTCVYNNMPAIYFNWSIMPNSLREQVRLTKNPDGIEVTCLQGLFEYLKSTIHDYSNKYA